MDLIDIGANLAHESFASDLEDVLERARRAGVGRLVVTGSDPESNRTAAAMARAHPGRLFATAGCHPHLAAEAGEDLYDQMRELAAEPGVVALGEMGLDFFRDLSPRRLQERVFERQLETAAAAGMPVFLHQRDAHERFLPILKAYRDALPAAVAHCFTAGKEELYAYLDLDCHIGITGWICDERRGRHLLELVRDIPADRLMLETDAPYLMPRTIRPRPKTRRNEPANLPYVLATVAEARGETPEAVAAASTATAERFFNLRGK
ncbi:Mg-dependent DNase [Salinisphaera sp. PC39]|uniref:TatD family hydrolase n=1 Tax=Salinisphaera sp. PC39 TaxID=1304156 RepID=UPI0033415246